MDSATLTAAREVFAWNGAAWERLRASFPNVPHAVLLAGVRGGGKARLATRLAQLLLCAHARDQEPCGACKNCHLLGTGTHPDLLHFGPPEGGRQILVDQVRAVIDFLSLRPHTAARKVVIIAPAEAMNLPAANSLLKILEEPPGDSHLILIAHEPGRLPATVRSRCVRSEVTVDPAIAATWLREKGLGAPERWLRAAGGGPIAALALMEGGAEELYRGVVGDLTALADGKVDPSDCAARWRKQGAEAVLTAFQALLAALLRRRLAPTAGEGAETGPQLQVDAERLDLEELFLLWDRLAANRNQVGGPLDETLLIEDVLLHWMRIAAHDRTD